MTQTDDKTASSPAPQSTPAQPVDFEHSLAELERLVERMEQGELSLEDSLRHFEHGVGLARDCQRALSAAEQRVEILLSQEGAGEEDGAALAPFGDTDGHGDG